MLEHFIDLLGSFAPMWDYALTLVMCLFFVASVPSIIRYIIRWR